MQLDWLISKTGMLIAFFVLSGVFYSTYDIHDEYSAKKEAEATVIGISNQIALVATTAPEYSAKRRVELPDNIHGEPYIFTLDAQRYNVKITLMGKYSLENITEFAMLPEFKINGVGFNQKGEVSVGNTFEGMNTSSALIVSKSNGNTSISAVM
jgi:hypothetical protein